ncbi:hypothetical protein ACFQO1_07045 [Jejudonia soesokkakensis]|uniref:Lipocalin-like domain-containing protein n=1 Tax=Jejudonia soesokkakensis TaxID=1323432 RepID=A0ABW2MV81_9FLAO
MKQKYMLRTLFLIIGLTLSAQNAETAYIPTSQVPVEVTKKQELLFPQKYVEGWQVISDNLSGPNLYICKFKESTESGFSATYTSNGILVYHSKFLPDTALPETAILKIRNEYDDFKIQNGYFITIPSPKQELYRIDLLDENRVRYVYYTTDGREIPEESLPLEIRLFEK